MTARDEVIRLARDEVRHKTFAYSQQLLAVHEIPTNEEGESQITFIDEEAETESFRLYFPVQGEPYFFVVLVQRGEIGQFEVAWVYMEARVRAYLMIGSRTVTPEEITAQVGIEPTRTGHSGSQISKRVPARRYRAHKWYFEPQKDIPGTVEHKLEVLLEAVRPVASKIASLKPDCIVRVVIVYEGWGGDWQFGGMFINAGKVQTLAALGAEVDIDLYAFGPDMLDDDELDSIFGEG